MPSFTPDRLLERLNQWPGTSRYWVALSGGIDSMALLHAMHALGTQLAARIQAVHVNHGLHPQAAQWAGFCEDACRVLGIPCLVILVDARALQGQSPEAWAREQRYHAMEEALGEGDMLLTAHHRDDQAETVLLQLLRGAGPRGLAAMPSLNRFGRGWLARPLLDFSREDIHRYASRHGLQWIEDPSNRDVNFDRNYLRHAVIPRLKERWPGLGRTLARAADWQAEAASMLDVLAKQDLNACAGRSDGTLSAAALKTLDEARRRQVIRLWLRDSGLPTPAASHLERIMEDVLHAAWDATPCVVWQGAEVRRYRDSIHAMRPLPDHDPRQVIHWEPSSPLDLNIGCLWVEKVKGQGVKAPFCEGRQLTVRFRLGGERCRPQGRRETHSLKHLFQEAGIPPWRRDRIPLIYLDETLIAVAGCWACHPFGAGPDEPGWEFRWEEIR
jgi:tRNA(Ile)-lysidine synthase